MVGTYGGRPEGRPYEVRVGVWRLVCDDRATTVPGQSVYARRWTDRYSRRGGIHAARPKSRPTADARPEDGTRETILRPVREHTSPLSWTEPQRSERFLSGARAAEADGCFAGAPGVAMSVLCQKVVRVWDLEVGGRVTRLVEAGEWAYLGCDAWWSGGLHIRAGP
jgi:hypothetical protein